MYKCNSVSVTRYGVWTRVFRAWLRGWPEMCARAAREKKSGYFRAAQGLNHLAGELVYARTPPGSIAQAAQAYRALAAGWLMA